MICPRCLNTDPTYFYKGKRGIYCRRCIQFSRVFVDQTIDAPRVQSPKDGSEEYCLSYPLTKQQKRISSACLQNIVNKDVLIDAVCGSGKTEIVLETICFALKHKLKIAFAIPRRQVVLELAERLQEIFTHASIVAVCGGHSDVVDGDVIVCTTHQLYRYYKSFAILILDEPDAFPFKGSDVLHGIAKTSCYGHVVYLTATPDAHLLKRAQQKELVHLKLNARPHGYLVPVPVVYHGILPYLYLLLLRWLNKHREKLTMVFVPTIQMSKIMYKLLKRKFDAYVVTSKSEDRDEVIETFRNLKQGVLVCTTVMERGVTISGVDVCVFCCDHGVFDEASLIQMAGRVGRSFQYPTGDVLFLGQQKSETVQNCITTLKEANDHCDACYVLKS